MTGRAGRRIVWAAVLALWGAGAACERAKDVAVPEVLEPGEAARVEKLANALLDALVREKASSARGLRSAMRAEDGKRRIHERHLTSNTSSYAIAAAKAELEWAERAVAWERAELLHELLERAAADAPAPAFDRWLEAHAACVPLEQKIQALEKREIKLARDLANQQRRRRRTAHNRKRLDYDLANRRVREIIRIRRKYDSDLTVATQGVLNARLRLQLTSPEHTTRRAELEAALKQYETDTYLPARDKFRDAQPAKWKELREEEEFVTAPVLSPGQAAQMEHADAELAELSQATALLEEQLTRLRRELHAWRAALEARAGVRAAARPAALRAMLAHHAGA